MLYWTTFPFLRILLSFVFGLIVSRYSGLGDLYDLSVYFPLCLYVIIVLANSLLQKRLSAIVWGHLLLFIIFTLGLVQGIRTNSDSTNSQALLCWLSAKAYIGTVSSYPQDKGKFWVYEVLASQNNQQELCTPDYVSILVYEKKPDTLYRKIRYGDQIIIEGAPKRIPAAKNPHAFDFREYLADRSIFLQHFRQSNQIKHISSGHGYWLLDRVFKLRSFFENRIESHIQGKDKQAVIKALLLGIKGDLDSETKKAYAAAGAMHVLAVSGLHVSVIYFIFNWLLSLIPYPIIKRLVAPLICIIMLWMYALLTGFSPSILRAVSMFSIVLFAKVLSRRTHIFNSLSLAAFVLLLYKPGFLFDVGFQLSFLAVFGILYVYPKISSFWTFKSWMANKVWQLSAVSIAAQLATFPISLYYFHQFPTYFLLSNLVVIPAAFIIMLLGILLITIGSWFTWIGSILGFVVHLLNGFTQKIQNLDGSIIEDVVLSNVQVLSIYCLILSGLALVQLRKPYYVWFMCFAALTITAEQSIKLIDQSKKKQLVFYSIKGSTIIDTVNGLRSQLQSLKSDVDLAQLSYEVDPFRSHNLLSPANSLVVANQKLSSFATLQVFSQKKILFLHDTFSPDQISSPLIADILVVSNQSLSSLKDIKNLVDCSKIILDTTNKAKYCKSLAKEAVKLGLEIVDLNDGYYLFNISGN